MRLLIVLSGPIAVGKSLFGQELIDRYGAVRVSTSEWMRSARGVANDRHALQEAGDALDRGTKGAWVAEVVAAADDTGENAVLLLDAARTADQVAAMRGRWGDKVLHVHLHADDDELQRRYLGRPAERREFATYAEARLNSTEAAVPDLMRIADLVLDTDKVGAPTLADTAMAFQQGAAGEPPARLVDVIVGGQYGSEGKGNVCAHLANNYQVLMRIGGPNAGHLVKEPYYKYVQLPSGTLTNKAAAILIGAGSTIWLPQILKEIQELGVTPDRLSIDPQAMIIDEDDRDLEGGALGSIASTKQGVGAASARKITNRGEKPMFGTKVALARDEPVLTAFVRDVREELDRHFAAGHRVMLEGTQGTLLSIHHGFWPSVTSRETSAAGCLSDAGIAPHRVRKVILVVRTYPIRVGGTSGWMGRKVEFEQIAEQSGIPIAEMLKVEKGTISGTQRRMAEFDWAQIRRSAALNGATDIAVTFADYLGIENRDAATFEDLNDRTRTFIGRLEAVTGVSVTLVSKAFAEDGVLEKDFNR